MPTKTKTPQTERKQSKKLSSDIDGDLWDRVQDAAVFLQQGGFPPFRTKRDFVEEALRVMLKKIERKHGKIPPRGKSKVRRGRPLT